MKMQYSPNSCVMFTNQFGNLRNRHFSCQSQYKCLKQRCKSALRSCPIRHKLSHAAFVTFDFRVSEMNVTFVLKEIKVTPYFFRCIVYGTFFSTADGTGKSAATPKININVEFNDFLIEYIFLM